MQDQLVFLFDVEQLLPLVGEQAGEESFQEERLNRVRQACLRVATFCTEAGRVSNRRRDLPCIGFRFYSSTAYFSLPPQLEGEWRELGLEAWDWLEAALQERMDQVTEAVARIVNNPRDPNPNPCLEGHVKPVQGLHTALEEVSSLYAWDRPALHSPVKGEGARELGLANSVIVVTRLPVDLQQLAAFMGLQGKKKPTVRDMEAVAGKRIRALCSGELNVALHLLDTGGVHDAPSSPEVQALFSRALRLPRGGVLPLPALTSPGLPTSSLLTAHLAELSLPSRTQDALHTSASLPLLPPLECRADSVLAGYKLRGAISSSLFLPCQQWSSSTALWAAPGGQEQLGALLSYLQLSSSLLLYHAPDSGLLAVLYPRTPSAATLNTLGRADSHFTSLLLRLERHAPTTALPAPVLTALQSLPHSLQLEPPPEGEQGAVVPPPVPSDSSWFLERWLLPCTAPAPLLPRLQAAHTAHRDRKGARHRNMLRVRESLLASTLPSLAREEDTSRPAAAPVHRRDVTKIALEKIGSGTSTVSKASSGSGGREARKPGRKSLSRGAMLRQMGEVKANDSLNDSQLMNCSTAQETDTATLVRECILSGKASAAASVCLKVSLEQDTECLVLRLAELQSQLALGSGQEDSALAGYAEACVSILLRHLDTRGVSKSSLEDLVTSRLLLDVAGVARQVAGTGAGQAARVRLHKTQVLLRAEVHWLLASQAKSREYEEAMLAHLRQVSLHGSNPDMLEFLGTTLTECYVDRQPELLCTLHDEMDLDRPRQLAMLFSPATSLPPSAGPGSVNSRGSCSRPSSVTMAPPPVLLRAATATGNVAARAVRSFSARPKSFDTSLNRSINLAPTRRERRQGKVHTTTGRMVTKRKVVSVKKRMTAVSTAKSPRKTVKTVKRNLLFEEPPRKGAKSPRKAVRLATPSKARRTPVKMTPGKLHRVLVPETPHHRNNRSKSDGNTSVAETPDKDGKTPLGVRHGGLTRKASFYQGSGVARASHKFEESFAASFLASTGFNNSALGNTSMEGGERRSALLFPHLVNKRKRSEEEEVGEPVRQVRRRLNSFSEPNPPEAAMDQLGGTEAFLPACSSTLRPDALSSLQQLTPRKGEDPMSSPTKRVQWNMRPQPPTPHRKTPLRPILKTPCKTPTTPRCRRVSGTPVKTPVRHTPVRFSMGGTPTTPRRDLATPSKASIHMTTPSKVNIHTTPSKVAMPRISPPTSPIIMSSRKKARLSSPFLTPSRHIRTTPPNPPRPPLQNTPGLLHGFNTPSPSLARRSKALSTIALDSLPSLPSMGNLPSALPSSIQTNLPSSIPPSMDSCGDIFPLGSSGSLLRPSSRLPTAMFDSSALTPRPMSRSPTLLTGSGDGDFSLLQPRGAPGLLQPRGAPGTPVKVDAAAGGELELVSPTKRSSARLPSIQLELLSPAKRSGVGLLNPYQELELVSPVKRSYTRLPNFQQELELLSPTKRSSTMLPSLQQEDPEELEGLEGVRPLEEDSVPQAVFSALPRFSSGYSSGGPHTSPPYRPEFDLSQEIEDEEEASLEMVDETSQATPPLHPISISRPCSLSRSSSCSVERGESAKIHLEGSPFFKVKQEGVGTEEGEEVVVTKQRKIKKSKVKRKGTVKVEHVKKEEVVENTDDELCDEPKQEIMENVKSQKKLMVLKSPARYRCEYCKARFTTTPRLKQHMKKELEEKIQQQAQKKAVKKNKELEGLQDKMSPFFSPEGGRRKRIPVNKFIKHQRFGRRHEDEETEEEDISEEESEDDEDEVPLSSRRNLGKETVVKEPDHVEDGAAVEQEEDAAPLPSSLPKSVLSLQDDLSSYYSGSGKRRRKEPERLAQTLAMQRALLEITPRAAKKHGVARREGRRLVEEGGREDRRLEEEGRRLVEEKVRRMVEEGGREDMRLEERERSRLVEEGETSTPVEGGRAPRRLPRVSYAEVPDTAAFDQSTNSESSPAVVVTPRKRFVPVNRFVQNSPKSSHDSPAGLRVTSGLLDESQDILDVSVAADRSRVSEEEEQEQYSPLPPKSPGKFTSMLTPGRGLLLKIRRVTKPQDGRRAQSPDSQGAGAGSQDGWKEEYVKGVPLTLPRLSRGACKEMGISPNKLQSIMAASPPSKHKSKYSATPEKENQPRTPKLILKKAPSMANSPLAARIWKAEEKISPVKRSFSPLSSGSIHKLSTSPIIHTQPEGSRPTKKRVNKQLAYHL